MNLTVFVKQLAVKLSEDNVPLPLRNQRAWHVLLYDLKNSNAPGKPAFLNDLWFDWDGPTPEAPELADLLARLHWNANISVANPQFDTATLPEPVAELWREQAPNLAEQEKEFLISAVDKAKQRFQVAVNNA
jgi:hypothetical protein